MTANATHHAFINSQSSSFGHCTFTSLNSQVDLKLVQASWAQV